MNRWNYIWKGALLVTGTALLIFAITTLGLLAFVYYDFEGGQRWRTPIGKISQSLTAEGEGYRFAGEELLPEGCWAMLLDANGRMVWSCRKPREVPTEYNIQETAAFSRWYLKDYPVECWVREDGLLVVGAPKGSMWKYNFYMEMQVIRAIPAWFCGIFLAALCSVLGVSCLAVKRWFRKAQQIRDAARSGWINGVSHDIRTPLSVVFVFS